jgi:hypothetical protein
MNTWSAWFGGFRWLGMPIGYGFKQMQVFLACFKKSAFNKTITFSC